VPPEEDVVGDFNDLDGDGYTNDDESKCLPEQQEAPTDSNIVPANFAGSRYPVEIDHPYYDETKLTRDENKDVIGYYWPDCLNPDDDQDGMPDDWESRFGLNPHDGADADGDLDSDSVTNLQEYLNGTDPTVPEITGFTLEVVGEDYASWLPEYGTTLTIRATWIGDGSAPENAVFTLLDTSRYPGRAVNDPDPAKGVTHYPAGYDYNGYDFGLATDAAADSYYQGPVSVTDAGGGTYTIYLRCWDYGGRTKVVVADPDHPNIRAELWMPRGSNINGIGSAWQYDSGNYRLNPNDDVDMIHFSDTESYDIYSVHRGDDFNNFEEYRGIVYTEQVGGDLVHKRLNPRRKDLFIRAVGYDDTNDASAPYPFAMGDAFTNAAIDVHNTTTWGHDATEDATFFTYYREGTIESIGGPGGNMVVGSGTDWSGMWPGNEWEFKLLDDSNKAWTTVEKWADTNVLYLNFRYPLEETASGSYIIRRPLPHINVLIVKHDRVLTSIISGEDGYIRQYIAAEVPIADNPLGTRHWDWSCKGFSICERDRPVDQYGIAVTLHLPFEHYFDDRPYRKGTIWTVEHVMADNTDVYWRQPDSANPEDMRLAPLSRGEDPFDTCGFIDGIQQVYSTDAAGADQYFTILPGNVKNDYWDGDRRLLTHEEWSTSGELSPFDIDNNGFVELPFATDPSDDEGNWKRQHDNQGNPYTKGRVLKHTITHEIGHALAGNDHSSTPACLMYRFSSDWKRDDYICDYIRSRIKVHNKRW
jgi:hypothetical protein